MVDTITAKGQPNRRVLAKAATRAKVLAAGAALFAEVGYEKATIRDIAKRTGMSTGAIFANFEDKAALYRAAHGHAPITAEQGRALLIYLENDLGWVPESTPPLDLDEVEALINTIRGRA